MLILALAAFAPSAFAADLKIQIDGLRSASGTVLLDLHNDSSAFPREAAKAVRQVRIKVSGPSVSTTVKNLPNGVYAFTFLHDENGNGRLDTNGLGIPTEGVGFSNDPTIGLSAPSFQRCSFSIEGRSGQIRATTKYF